MRYKISIPVIAFLIGLTILLVGGFQVYWLVKNYRDEARLFTTRTNILFRETVFKLQAAELNPGLRMDIRVDDAQSTSTTAAGAATMTHVLGQAMRDSLYVDSSVRPRGAFFTMERQADSMNPDSIRLHYTYKSMPAVDVLGFLAGVDSLTKLPTQAEITDSFHKALQREKITVDFRVDSVKMPPGMSARLALPDDIDNNMVTVGYAKPVSYQVAFGNNTWYLLKRIGQPILVSALLLGITILSFLLLFRNLQRQRQLAQLKNDFISNMTHELKTPIATVSVAIEALRRFDALDDRATTHEYLDISANEIQRLGLLVDKVLKLSMFENQEIALNKEQFDLRALTASVLESMKLQFDQRRAVTALQTTGNNFIITADKLHMTSVLYNLLDNALKYSPKNPDIRVHILDHGQYLEIRVTDKGMGIAKEYEQKIFEKFFRIPSGNRHNIKGYGLGLSYVAHIVRRHMGFIEVESVPDEGSTFSVKLPFAEAPIIQYDRNRRITRFKKTTDEH